MDVMMIDDAVSDITLMRTLFEREYPDINFVTQSDPVRALEELCALSEDTPSALPAVILLDINMPRLNGFEVQRTLQEHPDLRRIPVLFLTTSKLERDINTAYDLGANAFLTKPSRLTEMRVIVQRIHQFWLDTAALPFRAS